MAPLHLLAGAATAALIGGASPPPSTPAPALRLGALVAELRAHNPRVDAARWRAEARALGVRRAWAPPDPELTWMTEDVPADLGARGMVRYQANQTLLFPGKRRRLAEVAAREAQAARARVQATALDVVGEGKRLYFELLLNGEAQRLNREQVALVETLAQVALAQLSAGMAMHHEALRMQAEAAMLDDELAMLEADRRQLAAMLNALLERPADAVLGAPEATFTAPLRLDPGRLARAALARRPELIELAAMAAGERAMAAASRYELLPDLMVGAFYDDVPEAPDTLGGMVTVRVPLSAGRRELADAGAADLRAAAALRERAAMAAMVRAELEGALARVAASERRLALLDERLLPRAQQLYEATLAAFPAGQASALEVLDALRALIRQRLARVALRVARELALVDLERAVAAPPEQVR